MVLFILLLILVGLFFAKMEQDDLKYWHDYWYENALATQESYVCLTRQYDETLGKLREARDQVERLTND